ncbi:MAG: hypothetical protein A3A33_02270 [Candidatus Yanofskybacteria bacterium RIFCSPLOWO2_01_FULL_49_25]|uniref:Uncharacterized protein n=1 Tax=Candidatus Yanofskybacteria bacterium RIFCSPLOWO2_01_FULL_49_25 TaxID=1802701 RepID=A0A1F8GRW0_9BACT|nr:MAG: hypothetical protein A3A33_02270 [Candidatus Yanofskybacteria bacterium RIFCSPLOWO2_01_FULL_49_25]
MIKKILLFAKSHKVISGIVVFVLCAVVYHYTLGSKAPTIVTYALGTVQRGTLVVSVSGTGQVSTSNQIDVKPKASGDVAYIAVKNGQTVKAGTLLVQIDARDAAKTLRDAQINLDSAQIAYAKLQLNQQSNIPQLQDSITNAQNNLTKGYQDGYTDVSNAFLDLPGIVDDIRGVLYDSTVRGACAPNKCEYVNLVTNDQAENLSFLIHRADTDYQTALAAYNQNFANYTATSRTADSGTIMSLVQQTINTAQLLSQAAKSEQNMLDTLVADLNATAGVQSGTSSSVPSQVTAYRTAITSDIGTLNSHNSTLTSLQNSITTNQQTLINAQRNLGIAEKSNPLDIASQANSLKHAQAALQDARDNLANYYVRAPFTGVVAKVNINKGDSISSGTPAVTMITQQGIADVSLNEVDVAKIATGQKTTLIFDAVPGLTLTGEVVDVDVLGAVTQGVVTYHVKIGFDTQDSRVKSGMSVSAAIIIDVKQDALMIPNSAIKTQGGTSAVQLPTDQTAALQMVSSIGVTTGISLPVAPRQQVITTGITNDTSTEVTGGLQEGDVIVTRTISASTTARTSTAPSLFGGGGAGAGRALGR